jgi:hypothetical protein
MHEIKIVVVDAKRNWREILTDDGMPIIAAGEYRRDRNGDWETHCGVMMSAETAEAARFGLAIKSLNDDFVASIDCPGDWDVPDWPSAGVENDWKNYISPEIGAIWCSFAPFQKKALATAAQHEANAWSE